VALIEIEHEGVFLRGKLPMSTLELHLMRPIEFGGYYFPFRVHVARGGFWNDLEAEFDPGTGVIRSSRERVRFCDWLGIQSPRTTIDPELATDKWVRLKAQRIPFSAEFGGPVLFELENELTEGVNVSVLERRANALKILWQDTEGFLVGWVPISALRSSPPSIEKTIRALSGGNGNVFAEGPASDGLHCKKTLPLFARVDSSVARVGQIFPEASLKFTPQMSGEVLVNLPETVGSNARNEEIRFRKVRLLPSATLFVRSSDFAHCL
jgi:hypothetical protein